MAFGEALERFGLARLPGLAVQVRGTNGKGSTAHYLARILAAAGRRVLLFTSPHLITPTERIALDGANIPLAELARMEERLAAAEAAGKVAGLTYFEALALHAAAWGVAGGADAWVWETGLGGPLDATSAFAPNLVLLTPVGQDHAAELGAGRGEVAAAKTSDLGAVPALSAPQPPGARRAVARVARFVGPLAPPAGWEGAPRWQVANLALALAGAKALGVPARPPSEWRVPGRFHLLRPDPPIICDGAHNADALMALAASVRRRWGRPERLVVGLGAGRLTPAARRAVAAFGAHKLAWCPLPPPWQSAAPEPLGPSLTLADAAAAARWLGAATGPAALTGSLYLVGAALAEAW